MTDNEKTEVEIMPLPGGADHIPPHVASQILEYLDRKGIRSVDAFKEMLGPGMWAVIPMAILERPDLSANAKLLYAEVMALSKKSGKCFATNEYIASRLGLAKTSIPSILKELHGTGLLVVNVDRNSGGTYRTITVSFFGDGGADSTTMGGIASKRGQKRYRQRDIDKTDTAAPLAPPTKVFNLDEILGRWEAGKVRRFDILAWYIRKAGLKPATQKELDNIRDRHIRAATKLEPYTDEQLVAGWRKAKSLSEKLNFAPTLDTVLKQLTQ